jgi:mannosyltransferase
LRANRTLLALAAVVAAGGALRFATLPARSFWGDEAITWRDVAGSFGDMLDRLVNFEAAPPLYFALAWVWAQAFGTDEAALRSLPALLGTGTIPVAYAAATRLGSPRAGLAAAALTAVSPMLVWFSQDARPYSLLVLAGALSFLAFAAALERPAPGPLAAWAGTSVLALLSHYFAFFLVLAEAVWLLARHGPTRRVLAALAAPAAVGVALLPLMIVQRERTTEGVFLEGVSFAWRLVQIPAQYVVGFQPPARVLVTVMAALALPVAGWLLLSRAGPAERRGAAVAGGVGAAALAGPLVVALVPGFDYVYTRYTAAAWLPLAVVVAIAVTARRARWMGAAVLVWLCAFSLAVDVITADDPKFEHEDWRAASRAVGPLRGERALVVTPRLGRRVLVVYLPGVRRLYAAGTRVNEIAVLGLPPAFRRIGSEPRPPRGRAAPAPPGFVLAERREASTYTLLRYRARRPVNVSSAALSALALGTDPGLVVQRSPLRARSTR